MKNAAADLPSTRREFLKTGAGGAGLLAFSRFAPSFLVSSAALGAPAAEKDRTILVLVQLAGGNDGLNTVVPYADPQYRRLRPTLALPENEMLTIDRQFALHGACAQMHELLKDGKLGIVQNVGYPNPNRSHFRSTEIWESASDSNITMSTGWLGRYFDNACAGAPGGDPCGINIGSEVPQTFLGEQAHPTFTLSTQGRNRRQQTASLDLLERLAQAGGQGDGADAHDNPGYLRHTLMDAIVTERKFQAVLAAYRPEAQYPGNRLAQSLRNVAALIASGATTRIYYVSLGGFDTHSNQANQHANLLRNLSESLAAFQSDLEAHKLADQVLTMTFSEFGRRPSENQSRGTDHGTAAPLFVMGSRVKSGLHGRAPSLEVQRNQDLQFSIDFRQVYATVLDRWLGSRPGDVLGREFTPLGFI